MMTATLPMIGGANHGQRFRDTGPNAPLLFTPTSEGGQWYAQDVAECPEGRAWWYRPCPPWETL